VLEVTIRAVLALAIAAGFILAAHATAWRLAGPRQPLARGLAAGVALASLATVAFHGLSAARRFEAVPALAVSVVLAAAAWRAGGPGGIGRWLRADLRYLRRVGALVRRSPHRWWILALSILAAPGLLRAVAIPPLGWDALTYHGVKAAMWVQNGGVDSMVGTGPWGYYRNMLAGAEVFLAWAMLPMGADTLTGVVEVAEWLGLGLAVLVLARELGAREPLGSAAAAVVVSVPTIFVLPGSGYVEPVLLMTLVGSLALGIRGLRERPALLLLAGAGLGISASTKLPMVPLCGTILLLLAAFALFRGTGRARAFALAGGAAFATMLLPWLLLSLERTGAPFSPIPIRVGNLVLGRAAPELDWMLSRPLPAMPTLVREGAVLARVFHPPWFRSEALGLLALVPLAAAPLGLARLRRRGGPAFWILAGALPVSLALFFAPGLATVRAYWPISSSRFLLPFWTLAAAAAAAGARSPRAATVFRGVALVQLLVVFGYGFSGASWLAAAGVGGGALVLGGAVLLSLRRAGATARVTAPVLAAVAGLVLLAALRDGLRQDLLERDFVIHEDRKDWAVAVRFVDRPDHPVTLAVTSGPKRSMDNWFAYPFLGRRLQNTVVYVPVSRDGAIRPFGDEAAMETFWKTADYDAWRRRLHERGVAYVMSFDPASLEMEWMDGRPGEFRRLSGEDGKWGLYRVGSLTALPDTPGSSTAR
jgi:hypothetical protein